MVYRKEGRDPEWKLYVQLHSSTLRIDGGAFDTLFALGKLYADMEYEMLATMPPERIPEEELQL